jgi:hypothetical protein
VVTPGVANRPCFDCRHAAGGSQARAAPAHPKGHNRPRLWLVGVERKDGAIRGEGAVFGSWRTPLHRPAGAGAGETAVVEVPGIEPGSSGVLPGLLRAQFALSLLGPTGHANKPA